jgi:hypothetical protein
VNPTSSPTPTTLTVATLALIHFILIWTIAAGCSIRKCCFTPDRTRSLYSSYSATPSPFPLLGLIRRRPLPPRISFEHTL